MLTLLRKIAPYPAIDEHGGLTDGLSVKQPSRCRRCQSKSCNSVLSKAASTALTHHVCEFGYSLATVPTALGPLWLNGIFVPFKNTVMDAAAKKQNRPQKVPWEELEAYASSIQSAVGEALHLIKEHAQDAVAGLHDIKTGVNVVFRNAEAIVSSLPGADDYERIEGAPAPLKALLKSVNLLSSRLNLASLVANPGSARYGQRRRTPVYKLFHLMVRLFEQDATRKG